MREIEQVSELVSTGVSGLVQLQFRHMWTPVQIRAHRQVYWQLVSQVGDQVYWQVQENLST